MDDIRTAGDPMPARPAPAGRSARALRPRPQERGPLSYGQRRLWFLDRWLDGSAAYNVPATLRFSGPLDADRLVRALAAVAARHEVLFTGYEEDGGEPRQRLLDVRELDCPVVDLTDRAPAERAGAAERLVRAAARQPFDLAKGPMLRAVLYRLAEDEHWLHLTLHHIACDGWSLDVLQRQLLTAYQHGAQALDPLPVQYADYALWQREALDEERVEAEVARWREALRGAPAVLDLGADHPRPAEQSHRGRTVEFPLTELPLPELEELAAAQGASLYMVLLAGFQALAARHSGGGDIVLGSPAAGRGAAKLDELVGFFVDSLVLRVDLADDPSFRQLLGRARGSVLDALSRGRLPFDLAVNRLHPERSLGHNPIVQVVFAFHEEGEPAVLGDGTVVRRELVPTDTAKYDLTWSVHRGPDGLRLAVEYATDLFEPATVRLLVDHWQQLLRQAVADPDLPVGRLDLTTPAERALLAEWTGRELELPVATVHELVEHRAAETPDAVAVVFEEHSLDYRGLNTRANALAHHLRDLGVGPETRVGVCVERSLETVVATLAVLKAGGVYVPLDTAFPAERMAHMLREVEAPLVLTHGPTTGSVPAGPWREVDLDALDLSADGSPGDDLDGLVGPDNACYVIFTSGSTGRPKGTTVTHRNVTRLIQSVRQRLEFGPRDVWSLFHSFAFDFSVWEMWGALTTGGRLVVVPYFTSRNAEAFYRLVADEGVTLLSQTPSAFRQFETVDEQTGARLALRAVVFGGEALHRPSVRRWAARHGYAAPLLVNMYGITETTVHVSYLELTEEHLDRALTQLGRPLPDLRVYVLDEHGEQCPIGVAGELHVAGPGVTRGYTARPELSADRFVPDHLGGAPGGLCYRSGDLARWNTDGSLEYLGRADAQVKVRGYRIELGEIETALGAHPGVLECVVTVRDDLGERADLVGYLVPGEVAPSTSELRDWLGERLPGYMVPRAFVLLDALPLTPQGKVDRRALPAPDGERPDLAQEFVAPLAGAEELLAGIWSAVLGVDRVGRHDNFFDLGGDSIRSIQVLSQARSAGLHFALQDLFRHPDLATLAAVAAPQDSGEQGELISEPFALVSAEDRARLPEGLEDAYPMAELQVGMVYEMELDPDRRPYHNVDSLRIAGPFDEARFREATARVVARHPILRTSFDLSGYGVPMQLVHASAEMPFTVADLRPLDEAAQEAAIAAYVEAERLNAFDHARPLLLRFGLHRLGEESFQWTVTEHHAIFDGWSLHSTLAEITAGYQRLLAGEEPESTPTRSAYRDFVAAERAALDSAESEAFWLEKVADLPDGRLPRWPTGRPTELRGRADPDEWRLRDETGGFGSVETLLPAEVCEGLQALAKRCGVPFKAVVLAGHLRVVSLITGSSDVLAGLCANGRLEEADGAEVRGLFLNTVPLRLKLPEGSWLDLVRAVFEAERELLPHRRYPLGALQRKLGGGPLFEINFVYNHFHVLGKAFGAGRIAIVDGKIDSFSTVRAEPNSFPLNVGVIRNPYSSRLLLGLDYHTDVLTEDQMLLIRDYYLRTYAAMAAEPEARYREVPLLGADERALLTRWNDTAAEVAPVAVHRLVEARVAATPDAVALVAGDDSLTYAELNARANRLAHHLRDQGVGPDVCVGLCIRRSLEMVVGVLAILKAGGVYVPLDADFPSERLEFMLQQVGAELVLTHDSTDSRVPQGSWHTVNLDVLEPPATPDRDRNPANLTGPDNACYVIFTSGSTGRPKGVMTLHRNVTELLAGGPFLKLAEGDTLLQLAPLPFDNSTFEVWAPLVGGATLVLAPPIQYTPNDIAGWVARYGVNVLHATASLFALMVEHEPQLFDGLRAFLTGSETVSPRHAALILARCPQLELVNCWGPTETTTFSVCGVYTHDTLPDGPLPLGNPLVNTEVWVLDEAGLPVPVGTPGELHVAGPCLARGYLGNPELTADRFAPHPYAPGTRLYRTGDRGRWSVDGHVEFLGRVDHMVKVRGYRIELGEVEAALRAHRSVLECVVVVRQDDSGRPDLVGYLVADGGPLSTTELRGWLRGRLPEYMVPRLFVFLDALPLTPRAKVDRAALPAPDGERPLLDGEFVAPLAGVEELLAGIWSRVLGVARVGRHDNFFDLGGDSIRSIQVLGQARTAGYAFALQDVFRNPTLAELATAVGTVLEERPVSTPFSLLAEEDRERLPKGLLDAYPMTELQLGMVYEMERDPDRLPYHNVDSLRIAARFDEQRFRRAVAQVVERHPVLRTSFDLSGYGEPLQLVHATAEIPFSAVDLRGLPTAEQHEVLTGHVAREQRHGFDLHSAPLCRMAVHQLDDTVFQWTVTEHHAIFDGWSLAATLSEIVERYRMLLAGERSEPAPVRSLFRDFVAAERAAVESAESEEFWLAKVADRPDHRLPRWAVARPTSPVGETAAGESHQRDERQGYGALATVLPAELLTRLEGVARTCGVPFKAVVLAAHLRVMSLVTGGSDVLVGLTSNGRLEETDGTEARGLFLNTVPLRLGLPDGSWADLVRAAFEAERELLPHRRYPLGALQRKLGGAPLFEVNFVYNNFHQFADLAEDGTLSLGGSGSEPLGGVSRTHFPLVTAISREPGGAGLRLELEYDARELSAEQVTLLRGYYLRALTAIATDPQARHREASLLGAAEQALLASWNDNPTVVPAVPVHQLIERRAAETPDAVAVLLADQAVSYRELNARANRLAHRLRELGAGPEEFVGVCLERSVELVVGLLAVLKSGAAYVPMDASFPTERLEFMLRETGARLLLTGDGTAERMPAGPWQALDLDDSCSGWPEEDPEPLAGPDNACYVIFTSGSTGRPKGVVARHRNVTELLHGGDCLVLRPDDTLLHIAPISFDVSTYELWAPLAAGARLVVAPPVQYTPSDLAGWVARYGVTVLHATASLFALLVEHEPRLFEGLRRLLTGSETVSPRHTAEILCRYPELEVVNCWGPTETTTFSVCGVYTRDTLPDGPLPLGEPLANTEVLVLDERGLPVPVGTPGELHVAGPCLARGYLGNPELTADRFAPHPTLPGARLYRTGDRGRWSVDGRLEFLGRVDHMVKVRGYRIELGEIEAALERSPEVQRAVALTAPGPDGVTELRAFAAAAVGQQPDTASLRAHLESVLPRYLVPTVLTVLPELPVTANGKVDKAALLRLERITESRRGEPRPPESPLEQEVAAIWTEVLGVGSVDLADNFFLLGGNSLLAVRVLFLLRDRLFVELPLPAFLAAPDLAAFCADVQAAFDELSADIDLGGLLAESAGDDPSPTRHDTRQDGDERASEATA
ncbi:amino acid adenylation domain-containing protein [Kitasatospora sp. NPDC052896]|uniref:amino acid adenylation domain-containing protein n=1 Tax=Kitasatospora sp. NPDC052896 TaxID=3364061 RepID=UPI0037CC0138